jgi:GT2 family glycosyltransferase
MSAPLVIAVILNHNRPNSTVQCLRSLESSTYPNLDVVVLHTGHAERDAPELERARPGTEVIALPGNLGYAGGNNVGLALARGRRAAWVMLLNDDVLVDSDCIPRLVDSGQSDARIGMVGPTVYHQTDPQVIQSAGGRLGADWSASLLADGELDRGQYDQPRDVAWLSGCALMVRAELCERVGLLDERFFLYWEDVDWCLRAARSGWRIVHEPSAKVWHEGGRPGPDAPPGVAYYTTRNHLLGLQNQSAPMRVWIVAARRLTATFVGWSLPPKWQSQREARTEMWHGAVDFALRRFGERPKSQRVAGT